MLYLFESIASWSYYKKAIFIAMISLSILLSGLYFSIIPLYRTLQVNKQLAKVRYEELHKNKALLKQFDFYQQLALSKQDILVKQEKLLFPSIDTASIIQMIANKSKLYRLHLMYVRPKEKILNKNLTIIPFDISIQGNYHNLEQWLNDLSSSKPIMVINSFSMQPVDENEVNYDKNKKLDLNLLLYVYQTKTWRGQYEI